MNDMALYENITAQAMDYPVKLRQQKRKNYGFVAHWHEHVELLYILSGNYRITCGSESYDLKEKDIVFINSKEIHFSEQCLTSQFWCMHITPAFFSDIRFDGVVIQNLIRGDAVLQEQFEAIIREQQEQKEGYDLAIKGLTYTLIAYIMRHYRNTEKAEHTNHAKAQFERLNEVFAYISQNFAEPLSTASLAETFYLNEHYFCRLFKNATGQSVVSYINRLRIEKAIVMLENTSESITDIALRVGFNDLNYFSRIFRRFMEVSPVQYRRLYHKAE